MAKTILLWSDSLLPKKNYKIVKVIKIKLFKKLAQRILEDFFMIIII